MQQCPNPDICGSCGFSHLKYEDQLAQKKHLVNCAKIIPSPKTTHYRNRMDFVINYQGKVGLREKGKWWSVIDNHTCFIANEKIEEKFAQVRKWVQTCGLSFYDRKGHQGLLRYAVIRATTTGEPMSNIITCQPSQSEPESLITSKLNDLHAEFDGNYGLFGGLPWFHHFWSRDETISTIGLMNEEQFLESKKILFKQLDNLNQNGRLPDRIPSSDLDSADSVGWCFKRINDLMEYTRKKLMFRQYFSANDLEYVKDKLRESIVRHLKYFTFNGLAYNRKLETWMDTEYIDGKKNISETESANDKEKIGKTESINNREGFRIEIQALRLFIYKFMLAIFITIPNNRISTVYSESVIRRRGNDGIEYLTKLHDNVEKKHLKARFCDTYSEVGIDADFAKFIFSKFEEAMKLADDDVVRNRVERASLTSYVAMIEAARGEVVYSNGKINYNSSDK